MILVATPPTVSMDRDKGVTSIRMISAACEPATKAPPSFPPCTAAPKATHSSGLRFLDGSFPVRRVTSSYTAGIRVDPPTRSTIPRSDAAIPASESACCTGPLVRSTRSFVSSLNLARVNVISICFGSPFTVVINGRLMLVVEEEERTFFAFSASSRTRCIAVASLRRSIRSVRRNSITR